MGKGLVSASWGARFTMVLFHNLATNLIKIQLSYFFIIRKLRDIADRFKMPWFAHSSEEFA